MYLYLDLSIGTSTFYLKQTHFDDFDEAGKVVFDVFNNPRMIVCQ
jgi:hypothetical protein